MQRLADAFVATHAEAPVTVLLDTDDIPQGNLALPSNWTVEVSRPKRPLEKLNDAFNNGESEYGLLRYYGLLGDDVMPLTDKWDAELIGSAGHWNIAYPRDNVQNEALATHPVIGGGLVAALGWLALPGLRHLYADTVWTAIGAALDCLIYRDDIVLDHLHYSVGKSEHDATYKRHSDFYGEDKQAFEDWRKYQMAADLSKIKAAMEADCAQPC